MVILLPFLYKHSDLVGHDQSVLLPRSCDIRRVVNVVNGSRGEEEASEVPESYDDKEVWDVQGTVDSRAGDQENQGDRKSMGWAIDNQ